jgi:hypothetical protein
MASDMRDDGVYTRLDDFPMIDDDLSWGIAMETFRDVLTQEQRDEVLEIFTKANMEIPDARADD